LVDYITDFGSNPFIVDINRAAMYNDTFRTALWTGNHLQLTLMNIRAGEDIGLEVHTDDDQLLIIVDGQGLVEMGDTEDNLYFLQLIFDGSAIFIPAGTWHNITNTGNTPIKLYSIYAPPAHPWGTVHETKEIAEAEENY